MLSARYGFDALAQQGALFEENGLPHVRRERVSNSRAALNVSELARERGVHEQLHSRLMTAYWAEARDISDPDLLVEEGVKLGLDPDEVRDAATTHPYQERIQAFTAAVHEMGANGVPAFVVDDRVLIPGAQPHALFEQVMAKLGHQPVEPEG